MSQKPLTASKPMVSFYEIQRELESAIVLRQERARYREELQKRGDRAMSHKPRRITKPETQS